MATVAVLSVILKLYLLGAGSWCCVVHSWKLSVVGAFLLLFCMDSSGDRTVGCFAYRWWYRQLEHLVWVWGFGVVLCTGGVSRLWVSFGCRSSKIPHVIAH